MAEYKATPFASFKKDGMGPRTRAGVFAVLGNRDHGGDRLMPGCMAKTMTEQKGRVRFLWNHKMGDAPIAKVEDLYEISLTDLPEQIRAFAPDAMGGAVVVRTYLDTPRGNEILAALDADAINEMSFAYDTIKKEYVQEEYNGEKFDTRIIRELKLYEASDVLWGMNPATLATMSLPFETIAENLKTLLADLKAGRRNSSADLKMLQSIHDYATELGALCGEEEAEEEAPKTLSAPLLFKEADALMTRLALVAI